MPFYFQFYASGNWQTSWGTPWCIKGEFGEQHDKASCDDDLYIIGAVCLSVCHKSWNSSVNISQSQSEHSLRLTDQSEDSIRSAVSAEISFSI